MRPERVPHGSEETPNTASTAQAVLRIACASAAPSDALVYTEYDITDEPLDNRDIKKLPGQVQARIDDLYELAQHDPRQAIPELERLVTTYPHIPTLSNYLSIAYLAAVTRRKPPPGSGSLSSSSPVSLRQSQLCEPVSSAGEIERFQAFLTMPVI